LPSVTDVLPTVTFDERRVFEVGSETENNFRRGGNDPTDIHLSACQERNMPRGHHADDGGKSVQAGCAAR
jgi:hypothetical protein